MTSVARLVGALSLAFVFCATIMMRTQVLQSQDLYLHIETGRWIAAHLAVPDHGLFSGSKPDAPWIAHEWLAALAFSLSYDAFGWGGPLILTSIAMALAVAVVTAETTDQLTALGALAAGVLAWGLCVHHLVARPHVFAMPLLAVWVAALARARRDERAPPVGLALMLALWANLHGSFLFALVLALLFAGEAAFESVTLAEASRRVRAWAPFLVASTLAGFATPYGAAGFIFPVRLIADNAAISGISEWSPSSLGNNPPLLLWCGLIIYLALTFGVRLPVYRATLFMLLMAMAFAQQRHAEMLGLAAPLLLQDALAKQLPIDRLGRAAGVVRLAGSRWAQSAMGAATAAMIIAILLGARGIQRRSDQFTPAAALDAVAAHGVAGPVLNEQKFGGYLIFRGVPPFVDGRVDMYGGAFMSRFLDIGELPHLLRDYDAAWTLFDPKGPRAAIMDALPDWKRLYADDVAVAHVRVSAR